MKRRAEETLETPIKKPRRSAKDDDDQDIRRENCITSVAEGMRSSYNHTELFTKYYKAFIALGGDFSTEEFLDEAVEFGNLPVVQMLLLHIGVIPQTLQMAFSNPSDEVFYCLLDKCSPFSDVELNFMPTDEFRSLQMNLRGEVRSFKIPFFNWIKKDMSKATLLEHKKKYKERALAIIQRRIFFDSEEAKPFTEYVNKYLEV